VCQEGEETPATSTAELSTRFAASGRLADHRASLLSFLAHGSFHARCRARRLPPTPGRNIELLYYAFHIMDRSLGDDLHRRDGRALLLSWGGRLERSRVMLWTLIADGPVPYIATPPAG